MPHNRQSVRLRDFDYSQHGVYFVTICTKNHECYFGEIIDNVVHLNPSGDMIQSIWNELPQYYNGIEVDEFILMPNHIHGIIKILDSRDIGQANADSGQVCRKSGQAQGPAPTGMNDIVGATPRGCPGTPRGCPVTPRGCPFSLPDVVHRFKTLTTRRYINGVIEQGWMPFFKRLWQRNYYEHVIRNETELSRIREYIRNNPLKGNHEEEGVFS